MTTQPAWGPDGRPAAPLPGWARAGAAAAPGRGRLLAVTAAVLGLFVVSAAAAWLGSWYRPPRPAAVVLVGAGYEADLAVPHNVPGWRSLGRLAGARATDGWVTAGPPLRLLAGERWDRDLAAVADAPLVVVGLALHGGTDDRGPYLLPDDATGATDSERLRVADVVARLAELPPGTTKLLLLDAAQPGADWPLGQLRTEFARGLLDLAPQVEAVPNLLVLASAGPGQRAWASPEWGETVFGRAVREAVAGDAADADGDGWLQLDEAIDAVAARVDGWARTNRGVSQTPLLLPTGGEGRRRAERVSLGQADPRPPALPDPPPADLPPELPAAWAAADALRATEPAPAVYAPADWRLYLAALRRFEELTLAGDPANAGRLADRLRELAGRIDRARALAVESLGNSLAVPAVLGQTADPAAARLADGLWGLSPADAATKWAAEPRSAAVRAGVTRRLFELEIGSPALRTGRLVGLLRLVEDPARPRPAESQFLALFDRDAPAPRPSDELLRTAIRVRLQAERAAVGATDPPDGYAYGEQVGRFSGPLVEAGDALRLAGQDRLLLADAESWAAAGRDFEQAAAKYAEAEAVNAAVRRVLAARHRVAAELPFLTSWLAGVPRPADDAAARALAEQVDRAEAAWAAWHALGADFARADAAAIGPLAERADALGRELDALAERFATAAGSLAAVDLPSVWQEAEAALAVPLLPADSRRRLIVNLRRSSWAFLTQTGGAVPDPLTPEQQAERSDDLARRQGRLALAVLGRDWFDRPAGGQPVPHWEDHAATAHRLATFAADPAGWRSLLKAGQAIGQRFGRLPAAVAANDAASDSLARVAPPGPAARLTVNPAADARRRQAADLFARLGRRTWQEHWFALDPDDEPYYRRAGRLSLQDAAGSPAAADLRARLDAPGRLTLLAAPGPLGRTAVSLTSERTLPVPATLAGEPGAVLPPGLAAWQPAAGAGLAVTDPDRRPAAIGDKPVSLIANLTNLPAERAEADPPATAAPVPGSLTVRAWFRGQRIDLARPVTAYPVPAVTADEFPSPRLASVAVRAGPDVRRRFGTGAGAVAVVLDASGSMGPPAGEAFTDAAKYAQATAALEAVLRVLPAGTRVSVRVFGQAPGTGGAVNPEDDIRTVFPPAAWSADALPGLMAAVRYPAVVPWNESPVLRAMAAARDDLRAEPGSKTLVVLTDGADNRFDKDRTLNPGGKDFPTLLDEVFRGTGVAVRVVGFKVAGGELETARRQFAGLAKLDPPGVFDTADHIDALTAALARAVRPELRYEVDGDDWRPVLGDTALQVGGGLGGDRWAPAGLAAGGYRLRTRGRPPAEGDVVLAPGDRLLLTVRGGERLRFERALLSDDYPGRPAADARGWRLTVPQVQRRGPGVQALAWLEKRFDPTERQLQMLRPRAAWFELAGDPDAAVSWHPAPGYAAPAWGFDAPAWPTTRPAFRAWWNPDQEDVVAGRLDRGADFNAPGELAGRTLFVDGEPVLVRGVAVEEHVVTVAEGKRERKPCLVVRVAHGPGNPVRVRVTGVSHAGSSLRLYPEAGEVAALFWGVEPGAADRLQSVGLVSLRAFRREAQRRGFAATLADLPAPDPADERPRPPTPLP